MILGERLSVKKFLTFQIMQFHHGFGITILEGEFRQGAALCHKLLVGTRNRNESFYIQR